jgi:septum formation protein
VFRTIPDAEIERYIDSGSPMDKAGAYGIQDDYGGTFATRIEGCYYNVVGLPLSRLYLMLAPYRIEL